MKSLDQIEARTPVDAAHLDHDNLDQFLIKKSGSYYLTGNIKGVVGKNGIGIQANNVILDLNGFALDGGGVGFAAVDAFSSRGGRIFNGTVTGWTGQSAVSTSAAGQIDHVTAMGNAGFAMFLSADSVAHNCTASQNGGGIITDVRCGIRDCVATFNTDTGFMLGANSEIEGCIATKNGSGGFILADECVVRHCAAGSNGASGFDATGSNGVIITFCSASANHLGIVAGTQAVVQNCSASANQATGISATAQALVLNCLVTGNAGNGIAVGSASRVSHNQVDGNAVGTGGAGIFATSGENRIDNNNVTNNARGIRINTLDSRNLVVSNTTRDNNGLNYDIASGNRVGTIVIPPLSGNISGDSDADAKGMGTTDPWANLSY